MNVEGRDYRTVWMEGDTVCLIEQNLLPFEFNIFRAANYRDTCVAFVDFGSALSPVYAAHRRGAEAQRFIKVYAGATLVANPRHSRLKSLLQQNNNKPLRLRASAVKNNVIGGHLATTDPILQARSVDHNGQKPPSSTAPITVHQIPHLNLSEFINSNPPYISQPQGVNKDINSPNGYMETISLIPRSLPGDIWSITYQLAVEKVSANTGPRISQKANVFIELFIMKWLSVLAATASGERLGCLLRTALIWLTASKILLELYRMASAVFEIIPPDILNHKIRSPVIAAVYTVKTG